MPMSRYQIRNEYSLADPELYGAADNDDPEALLEGVAMAGLVGVLRQLGDLAEFAAEIFHDLHEEVMATATRGHGLTVRVKQLEAEFPLIEKAFLSQTSPSAFFSNAGLSCTSSPNTTSQFLESTSFSTAPCTDCHPSLHTNQTLITGGDLPRFIMDSYEECRGPPRLFLLDKFDVAGAGACLKRYTDPSFFKVEASSYEQSSAEFQKEKRSRKSKKKGSRWRNNRTPDFLPASHAKLHQLFLEDRVENAVSNPARLVKLKRRLNGFPYSKTGKSLMEIFINASSPEDKVVHEIAYGSSPLKLPYEVDSKSGTQLLQTTAVSNLKESTSVERTIQTPSSNEVCEDLSYREISSGTRRFPLEVVHEKEIAVDGESKPDGYQSDDVASEVDNYMDALATMESEIETDAGFRTKYDIGIVDMEKQGTDCYPNEELLEVQYSDLHSTRNSNPSDDGNNSFKKGSSSFSYSDTGSTAAENMTVDVEVVAEVLPSTQDCEAEVGVMSIEKVFTSEELSVSQPHQSPKLDVSDDTSNEVREIPSFGSESGEPSTSFCISNLPPRPPTHSPLDEGEIFARGTLRGPQLVKTLANHEELDIKFFKTGENNRKRGNNIPWNSRHSTIPSKKKDDEPRIDTESAATHNLDKLDDDPGVLSSASIQISKNISEVIPKKYDSEGSMNDLLEAEHEDICTEDDSQISPAHSVILHAEDETSVPAYMNFETTNMVRQLEVVDSVDNVSPSATEITVNSGFASDKFNNFSIAEQQGAQSTDDAPKSIFSAADTCHEEKTSKGVIREADSGEIGEITDSTSLIRSETTALNNFTDHLNSSGCSSFNEFPVPSQVDDIDVGEISSSLNFVGGETTELQSPPFSLISTGPTSVIDEKDSEIRQSESSIVATLVPNHDSDADKVDSSSERNLPAEYCRPMQESDKYGFEVYDKIFPKYIDESDKQSEDCEDIALPALDTVQYETAFCDHSDSEMVSQVSESFLAAEAGSSLKPEHSNIHEHLDDSLPSSTHHFPELRTHIEQKLTLQADHIDHLHVEESIPKNLFPPQQLSCSDHLDEGSIDADSEPCLGASKPVVQVNVQDDSLAVETLYGDQTSSGLSTKLDSDYSDHAEYSIASPRSSSVLPPRESIKLELSQPGNNEIDISEQGRDQLSKVRPGFPLLPEVPQIDLPEMPPLPPLPPVQWRIGRTQQHASGSDSGQNTFGLVQPMFPFKTDNTSQVGYPTFNRDSLLPPVPVLPLSAVKNEDHQHVNEHKVSNMTYSSPLSMQIPVTSNNTNSQDDFLTSDRTSMNPFLTLSSIYNEGTSHDISAGEAGSMQSSLPPSSAVTTSGDATYASESIPSQRSNQMPPEVDLEPEGISISAEIRVIKFLDTSSPQPIVPDEQPMDVPTTSVGEKEWSTSNSFSPAIEDGTLNENRQMKHLRPRTPLIDAVAAHDKNMLRKVKERARPEVQKVEERDTLLEQIRAKSFSLKPALVTRTSIQGPKTNLRVAAILEKANAIRQALAGSDDEDDDEGSWSDS